MVITGDGATMTWLPAWVAEALELPEPPDPDRPLADLGISSRESVTLVGELEERLDRSLPPDLVLRHPTLRAIAAYLDLRTDVDETGGREVADAGRDLPTARDGAIAVVGIGCRLPGGIDDVGALWDLIVSGGDAISQRPPGRWEPLAPGGMPPGIPDRGGFLGDLAGFDAEAFGITPVEALGMDPQQRIVLEVVWEALAHGGTSPEALRGTDTAVLIGAGPGEYGRLSAASPDQVDARTATGLSPSVIANRVSYLLDVRGPSLTIDSACSSSLVAVHQAVRALQEGDVDLALAGGVNLLVGPAGSVSFAAANALAPDGRCKPFGAAADGIGRSEGCVILLLKRERDAVAAGDRVLALIRGSAVNSDGRSNGLTAPNPQAQVAVLRRAYARAGVDPGRVGYVEAHGTGTPLGDPAEAAALAEVVGAGRAPGQPVWLGSVKGALGHLEAAAGAAGVAAAVLAMHHSTVPPAAHARTPHPGIPFGNNGLALPVQAGPWPADRPWAGVSAFGFGGTNAHVVLERHASRPRSVAAVEPAGPFALVVAGPTPAHVTDRALALADWLVGPGASVAPADLAHTLARHRGWDRHGFAVAGRDHQQLAAALRRAARTAPTVPTGPAGALAASAALAAPGSDAVWIFSGFGSVWPGMGHDLLAGSPGFARAIAEITPFVHRRCGFELPAVLSGHPTGTAVPGLVASMISLYAVQLGLAAHWHDLGARPAAVIGQSLGEVAAAVVAGELDPVDGARVIVERALLMASIEQLGDGAMAAVEAPDAELAEALRERPEVTVAVEAAPGLNTVTGPAGPVAEVLELLQAAGHRAWPLGVGGAGHSAAVDPLIEPLLDRLDGLGSRPGGVPRYSTVDPTRLPRADADYWAENLRRTVRLRGALEAAVADGHRLFLELSPHPVATGAVTRVLDAAGVRGAALAALRRDADGEVAATAAAAGYLLAGGRIDAERVVPRAKRCELPPPRWLHRPFWPQPQPQRSQHQGEPLRQAESLPQPSAQQSAASILDPGPVPLPDPGEPANRPEVLAAVQQVLIGRIAEVSGIPAAEQDPHLPLLDLGLDSLMAVRIQNAVQVDLGVTVPPTLLLRGASTASLALAVTDALAAGLTAVPERAQGASTGEVRRRQAAAPVLGGRDPVERWVATVCQEALQCGPLDVTRPLTEDRLDPTARAQISRRLHDRLLRHDGRPIAEYEMPSEDELFVVPTIEALADRLRALFEAQGAPTRVLRAAGPGDVAAPLVLFHPAGASCSTYEPLVGLLPAGFAVVGLERDDSLRTVESKAAVYADLLLQTYPEGPYRLGGWSLGGCLAFATGQLLATQGHVVELVAMIDTIAPHRGSAEDERAGMRERFARFFAHLEDSYGLTLPVDADTVSALPDEDQQIEAVVEAMRFAGVPLTPAVLEHQRASYLDTRVAERYRPPVYSGRTVLYRTASAGWAGMIDPRYDQPGRTEEWAAIAPLLELVPVEGDHSSIIDRPWVDAVAAHLGALLLGRETGREEPSGVTV